MHNYKHRKHSKKTDKPAFFPYFERLKNNVRKHYWHNILFLSPSLFKRLAESSIKKRGYLEVPYPTPNFEIEAKLARLESEGFIIAHITEIHGYRGCLILTKPKTMSRLPKNYRKLALTYKGAALTHKETKKEDIINEHIVPEISYYGVITQQPNDSIIDSPPLYNITKLILSEIAYFGIAVLGASHTPRTLNVVYSSILGESLSFFLKGIREVFYLHPPIANLSKNR